MGEAEPNSFWDKVLKFIKWKSGRKIPVGRGFFQYSFGIVPRRHPIVSVGEYSFKVILKHNTAYNFL